MARIRTDSPIGVTVGIEPAKIGGFFTTRGRVKLPHCCEGENVPYYLRDAKKYGGIFGGIFQIYRM
jgi:hypothetical protein